MGKTRQNHVGWVCRLTQTCGEQWIDSEADSNLHVFVVRSLLSLKISGSSRSQCVEVIAANRGQAFVRGITAGLRTGLGPVGVTIAVEGLFTAPRDLGLHGVAEYVDLVVERR